MTVFLASDFSWLNEQKLCKITRKCVQLKKMLFNNYNYIDQ